MTAPPPQPPLKPPKPQASRSSPTTALIRDTDAVDYYVTFDSVAVGEAQAQYLSGQGHRQGQPLYLYAGARTPITTPSSSSEGAWNVLQPKIADGTFVIKNSSEAVALQDKPKLTREEMGKIIGQITTNWDFNTAKNLAEANLTKATAADKGNVFILAPNDGTARAIADAFRADKDVTSYVVTGQDAEKASIQYIIDGKQSMTVLKDVRTLVADAISAAIAFWKAALRHRPPPTTTARLTCRPKALCRDCGGQEQRQGRHHRLRLLAGQRLHRPAVSQSAA